MLFSVVQKESLREKPSGLLYKLEREYSFHGSNVNSCLRYIVLSMNLEYTNLYKEIMSKG